MLRRCINTTYMEFEAAAALHLLFGPVRPGRLPKWSGMVVKGREWLTSMMRWAMLRGSTPMGTVQSYICSRPVSYLADSTGMASSARRKVSPLTSSQLPCYTMPHLTVRQTDRSRSRTSECTAASPARQATNKASTQGVPPALHNLLSPQTDGLNGKLPINLDMVRDPANI